jgi:hypothetical protein
MRKPAKAGWFLGNLDMTSAKPNLHDSINTDENS